LEFVSPEIFGPSAGFGFQRADGQEAFTEADIRTKFHHAGHHRIEPFDLDRL
jgi:hypothetical protein